MSLRALEQLKVESHAARYGDTVERGTCSNRARTKGEMR